MHFGSSDFFRLEPVSSDRSAILGKNEVQWQVLKDRNDRVATAIPSRLFFTCVPIIIIIIIIINPCDYYCLRENSCSCQF
jgi:hypothetical protein